MSRLYVSCEWGNCQVEFLGFFIGIDFALYHLDYTRGHIVEHLGQPGLPLAARW